MALNQVITFDPRSVTTIYGGQIIDGLAEDNPIQVQFNKDQWTMVVDKDGKSTRIRNNDQSGRITLTLLQSSPANDALMALALSDLQTNSGALNFLIKDGSGRTVVATSQAWNVKLPDITFSTTLGNRVWVYETGFLDVTIGGN